MDALASLSLMATSMASLSSANLGGAAAAVAQDPTPATISGMDQADVQSSLGLEVLKRTLDLEASAGSQIAQMVGQSLDVSA